MTPAMTSGLPSRVVLVKLGGSLITDKRGEGAARDEVIERLAGELAEALPELGRRRTGVVVGHGSGSFGHVAARRAGYRPQAAGERRETGAGAIQVEAATLHLRVARGMTVAGVEALSLAPSSLLLARGEEVEAAWLEPVREALRQRLVPLLWGDVVLDREAGYTIVSTERVLSAVALDLAEASVDVVEALWLGETAGVYDADGRTVEVWHPPSDEEGWAEIGGAAGTDVTGGMRHRLESVVALARRGIPSRILDGSRAGVLAAALRGEEAGGTRVPPPEEEGS